MLCAVFALASSAYLVDSPMARAEQPPGRTTLVLGDQVKTVQTLVEAAGVMEDAPYDYRWASFQGAAPLFEALRAGAVDTAMAGDLPVLAAASGDAPMKIIATRQGEPSSLGIVVQRESPIGSVADLEGRQVVVSSARGSISQYQLYGALREAGLEPDDVEVRFVLPTDAMAAFNSGQIDAWATFDPYFAIAVEQGARVLRDGTGINPTLGFITAAEGSLEDPAKRAAIEDFLRRLARAGDWARANPERYGAAVARQTRLPEPTALEVSRRSAYATRALSDQDIATLQQLADSAVRDNILPRAIDVAALSDQRLLEQQHAPEAP